MFCSKCGAELSDGSAFCAQCGYKVNNDNKEEAVGGSTVKLVPAKCTGCGGDLKIDPDMKEAKCPYCGTSFIVDQAIKNYVVSLANGDIRVENATINVVGDQTKKNRRCCPKCGSTRVERMKTIYNSGTMGLNAIAKSDDIFDNSSAKITGTYKSKLAESVAPPEPKKYLPTWKIVLFVFLGLPYIIFFMIEPTFMNSVMSAIAILLLGWSFKSVNHYNNTVYPELMKNWENSWVCLDCDTQFSKFKDEQ